MKRFVVDPEEQYVKVGATAAFTCVTAVAPSPTTYFFLNEQLVNWGGIPGSQTSGDEYTAIYTVKID